MESLLKKAQQSIVDDHCYPEALRKHISEYQLKPNQNLLTEIRKICKKISKNGDGEIFYSQFFSNIVRYASNYLDMTQPSSTLVAKKLAGKTFNYYKSLEHDEHHFEEPNQLTYKEIDALQYLSGYIVWKFIKKTRNGPKYNTNESQTILSV